MKLLRLLLICVLASVASLHAEVTLFDGHSPLSFSRPSWQSRPVTEIAEEMFTSDIQSVTGLKPVTLPVERARIKVINLSAASSAELTALKKAGIDTRPIAGKPDGFMLKARRGNLYAVGVDDRATAYALLELSRLAGVSPWVWWNDSRPSKQSKLSLPDNFSSVQIPSVDYRGVFLNDEDWSSRPWSTLTYEPGGKGLYIGVNTYRQMFRLLLRLRANTVWPAMHELTPAFYKVAGAKEAADSCAIAVGTSHCQPLLCNNVDEWDVKRRGPFNYITNGDSVRAYWTERLKEVRKGENLYTLGMRGIHDGPMEGVKTMDEKLNALQRVIDDQRRLLAEHVSPNLKSIPQVFVPYKEVLDIMERGLSVPEDVTLMWCDDNYGYMTRLSNAEQRRRSGGAGVYYHLSYWGRPHDYLWLATTQPGLIVNELREAYNSNARRIWIANAHDLKIASYPLELFLDLAWNFDATASAGAEAHLNDWLCREYGTKAGAQLLPVMKEYYRLCAIRRPEHMGWTQVELSDRKAYPRGRSHVIDTEFSFSEFGSEADRYLRDFRHIADRVDEIESTLSPELRDSYFVQVKYPVACASAMAHKMLEAQRARSYALGQNEYPRPASDSLMLAACARSLDAYYSIRDYTAFYNDSLAGGKWRHSMNMSPRDLCVFNPPTLPVGLRDAEIARLLAPAPAPSSDLGSGFVALNADAYSSATFTPSPVAMLGHSQNALPIPMSKSLTYNVSLPNTGDVSLIVALIPTQPSDKGDIRIRVDIDGQEVKTVSYKEAGRTDKWKENVMRNQALIRVPLKWTPGHHSISLTAMDSHVVLDQIMVDSNPQRKFYVIPTRK